MQATLVSPSARHQRHQCIGTISRIPLMNHAPARVVTPRASPALHLTPRQREVLSLLCEGLPNKSIARTLDISAATVKAHIGCILLQLGVTSRLQAVISAHSRGLVAEPSQEFTAAYAAPERLAA